MFGASHTIYPLQPERYRPRLSGLGNGQWAMIDTGQDSPTFTADESRMLTEAVATVVTLLFDGWVYEATFFEEHGAFLVRPVCRPVSATVH